MTDPKAVRLRNHEESYVNQQDKPFSDIVREPITENIIQQAIGVCAATGTLQYDSNHTPLETPDMDELQTRISGDNIVAYKDHTQPTVTAFDDDFHANKNQITPNSELIQLYPFTNAYDIEAEHLSYDWGPDISETTSIDADTLWVLETMAVETAGGKPWDYLISLLVTLSQSDADLDKTDFLAIGYMRGLAILEMLSEAIAASNNPDNLPEIVDEVIHTLTEWMAHIEEAYVIPAHSTAHHRPDTPGREQTKAVAGVSNPSILNRYVEKALDYTITSPETYVIKLPAGGDRRKGMSDSPFSIEWITGNYRGSKQITQFYPATAILGFVKYTSKTLVEWFVEAAPHNQKEAVKNRVKIGNPDDDQEKYAVIPSDTTPVWSQHDDQYLLFNQPINAAEIHGVISDTETTYAPADSFSVWCRYDDHQDEWVVYPGGNQQLRYNTKQELTDDWQFVTTPNTSESQQRDYTLDASNIGEIGLPHQVTEISMARDIYKAARENWDGLEEASNGETTTTETRGQQAGWSKTAELKDTINEIAQSEKELCMIDPKGGIDEQLLQQLPASISDNITLIDANAIDEETLASLTLLEPDIDEDHSQYDEEVETIVSNLTDHMEVGLYWGPRMVGIVKNIIRTMIGSDQVYTPTDLYDVLIDNDAREEFVQSLPTDETPTDTKTEVILSDDIEFYNSRIEQMDDAEIDPVARRLQDIVEDPHKFAV